MSTIARCVVMVLALICSSAEGQKCGLSGKQAWNAELRNMVANCPEKFGSPNGRFVLRIRKDGGLSVLEIIRRKQLMWDTPKVEPPAMISWSPGSGAFFLNDGQSSGMSSVFRFFRLNEERVVEDRSIERAAVSLYRSRVNCDASATDPNVWGIGWPEHGRQIVLLVQPTVNEPCGQPGDFISVIVRERDGAIMKTLSKAQTKVKFGSKLPATMFLK